jgi:methionyl-tRNA synthetase
MSTKPDFYITTAISYPNGAPHIGHAYEALATDSIARFKRLDGYNVFFLTGADEHGLKMQKTAVEEGISPKELSDRNVALFIDMVRELNCSNDDFIRTTEQRHHASCTEIWKRMEANGDIYLDTYAGWYSVRDEAFYAEEETTVNGDGVRLGSNGTPVEWTEEQTYFFRLSAYQDRLIAHYEKFPEFILPSQRRNEVMSFVKGGLLDLSVSRTTFDWGIPVPGAPDHIMYVWVDALTNYITAMGFPDEASENFTTFWPADVHIVGKDILRFHAVYWPAFLMSAGIELPKRVFAHGFLFNRGEKMSKSIGNVIDPITMAHHYGVDQMRYFFLREVPFGQDGNYSHEAIVNRINADLANDFGNLAQRSLSMIAKNCDSKIPMPGEFTSQDVEILARADSLLDATRAHMDTQALHNVLSEIWAVVADANRYFAAQEPWVLRKSDPTRMRTVLYVTAEVVRQISILTQAFMPDASARMLDQLSIDAGDRQFSNLGEGGRLPPGNIVVGPAPIFPRYVDGDHGEKSS